jgi:dephospho-CoA kinase
MKILGLLGGIASGKSMVADLLAACGAKILNADIIGHEILCRPEIEAAIRERWGADVFDPKGRVDRSKLSKIVFATPPAGPRELEYLVKLTHPEIIQEIKCRMKVFAEADEKVIVFDAPLLAESGLDKFCDSIIFIDAPYEQRLKRAIARGWRKEDFNAREAAQKSLDFKRERADVIIDNSGSSEETQSQISRLWQSLIQ